jgi:hypothetical protein
MKDATLIAILLDRSGSMASIKADTIGGFNNFLRGQQAVAGECRLSLTQFDTGGIDIVHENARLEDVPELTDESYVPRGGTPLLDALAKTINSTGRALKAIPESDRPDKVVFVVITDGEENASHEYRKSHIRDMIEHQESVYRWNFVFLGANQDAFAEAGAVGIGTMKAAAFAATPQGTQAVYSALHSNVASYRGSGQSASLDWSAPQRAKMADDDSKKKSRKK